MAESLFSSSWYRVAGVRPRLRNHAQIHRHVYRGDVWYVMQNHSTGKFHRFSPTANLVIGLMNGKRTLQEIWDLACARLDDDAPTQDEVIKLLSDLHKADVLQSDAPPDIQELHQRRQQHKRMQWKQYLGNPMSLRFPLFDPEKIVQKLIPFVAPLFSWMGAVLWVAIVGWAITLAGMHWNELSGNVIDQVFSFKNLLLMVLVFPVIKLLHEFGHAFATKAHGGEVHEMGIMLLVLMPIPYVDASAATAFRDKYARVLVGAAGMLVEIFIAAMAMIAWVYLEPGIERAIAYNVIIVAGVSTVLFNGNPLLRFDAYYMLSDYLEIPNLGQRANEYLGYLTNHYLFGVEKVKSPVSASGERSWFVFYAIASFVYRMLMMISIVLLFAEKFFVVGVILALWSFYSMVVKPLSGKVNYLFSSPQLKNKRQRALFSTGLILFMVGIILFWLPAPSSTRAEGVIWAPEKAQVRTTVDGVIVKVLAKPNQLVRMGDLLIQCEDLELQTRMHVLQAQYDELQARYSALISTNLVQANIVAEQIKHVEAALVLANKHLSELEIRSPANGIFVIQDERNVPGRLARRGELLAYITDTNSTTVRVVVDQADGDMVKENTQRVEVRPVEHVSEVIPAKIIHQVPAATDELPSHTLSLQGGGKVGIDPSKTNESRALVKLFILDLELPPGIQKNNLGERIYVLFIHPPEPLAYQWYRSAQRIFMKKFNI